MQAEEGELAIPLLEVEDEAEASQQQQHEIRSAGEPAAAEQGDLEQGLSTAGSDAGGSNKAEDEAAYAVSNTLALLMPKPRVHATAVFAAASMPAVFSS